MSLEIVTSAITSLGFPIVACSALGVYIKKRDEQQIEDRISERKLLLEQIEYNRSVNAEILATNRILAGEIKVELQDIKNEIQHLKK